MGDYIVRTVLNKSIDPDVCSGFGVVCHLESTAEVH